MKTLRPLLLIFSALAAGLWAKDESSAPAKSADPARDLVWPEITNAKALIALAKVATKDDLAEGIHGKQLERVTDPLLDYLHPLFALAHEDFIDIILDTHPFTGQAIVVVPHPRTFAGKQLKMFAWIQDTDVPGIKRGLIKLPPNSFKSLAGMESYVKWKNLTNETPDKASCPYPMKVFSPVSPTDMSQAGIVGEAKVTFTVTKSGEVTDIVVTATHAEFAGPAEEAIKLWKFEPGVDLNTRLPVAARVSVTAVYTPAEMWYQ